MAKPEYTEGTFCWNELATRDISAAKTFYRQLFGWQLHDNAMPGEASAAYTMASAAVGEVAGMYGMQGPMFEGMSPFWMAYVWVDSCDRSAAAAEKLGAKLLSKPMDVPGVGRICWAEDPTGATFGLFQAGDHPGACQGADGTGTFCWNEIMTPDVAAATAFYTALFGWEATVMDMGPMGAYTIFSKGGAQKAGCMQMPPDMDGEAPYWASYVAVGDCDKIVATATGLGATVCAPPMDIPGIGRFACVEDPTGAAISVIKLAIPEA